MPVLAHRRVSMTTRSALISGASIAGPALAFWLSEAGWDVTVVERAERLRTSGYPVDVRGTAIDVVRRMGLYDQIVAERYRHVPVAVLSPRGRRLSTLDIGRLANDREAATWKSPGACSARSCTERPAIGSPTSSATRSPP